MMKRTLFTIVAAATISSLAIVAPAMFTPAAAQAYVNFSVGAPAPVYYEVAPAPVGYVWSPGYSRWDRDRYWWHSRWHRHWDHDRDYGWHYWRR
jgi:hypothetical protein